MDSSDLLRMKKKPGPGSSASIRSNKSVYRPKGGPGSTKSQTSALIRDIVSHINEKDKPQAIRLTEKINKIQDDLRIERSGVLYDTLILPYNKSKFFDSVDDAQIKKLEAARARSMTRVFNLVTTVAQGQPNEKEQKSLKDFPGVAKLQRRMNMMIIAFRMLKKYYFPNDLYRIVRAHQWENIEDGLASMLKSPFFESQLFGVSHLQRLASIELLQQSSLPETLSMEFYDDLCVLLNPKYLGGMQGKVVEAVLALARVPRFRQHMDKVFRYLLSMFEKEELFRSNIENFYRLLSELALYQDIDFRSLGLMEIFLDVMNNPGREHESHLDILRRTAPDVVKTLEEMRPPSPSSIAVTEESKKEDNSEILSQSSSSSFMTPSRKVSRKASMASIKRLNTRSSFLSSSKGPGKLTDLHTEAMMKAERLKEIRKNFEQLVSKNMQKKIEELNRLDEYNSRKIHELAATGLYRLMLPATSFSHTGNVSANKVSIYKELLERDLVRYFMFHPSLKEENSEVKRCCAGIICLFTLQTTTESYYESEPVIFYLKNMGLLNAMREWSQDDDLHVRSCAAWIFTAICVHKLVPPLELTNMGLVKDMFVLFIKQYAFPDKPLNRRDDYDNVIDKIRGMYDYEHFSESLDSILGASQKIQHLLFATFIYLSIYDDQDITASVHKSNAEEADKPVQELALAGLKELLEKADKMKLFIEILFQFTICDDIVFQTNGIWYLKHIIINPELNVLLEAANVEILGVFIAGCVCESFDIQQECVNVLTYLAIEKKAYKTKDDPLLDALMYLTGVPSATVRGLAYNGLAALALHGAYASEALLRQANVPDYFSTITSSLKKFRQRFVRTHENSETVAMYSGINLLLNLSRAATLENQHQVSERVPLILDTICAQNQLNSDENMNEVGVMMTLRALMQSSSLDVRQKLLIPFIKRVATEKAFRLSEILINNQFPVWCLELIRDSDDRVMNMKTAELLREVLYDFYDKMVFHQEETLIRNLITTNLQKYPYRDVAPAIVALHEKIVECTLLMFVRKGNLELAVTQEILEHCGQVLDTYLERAPDTQLALSKHLASTAHFPQTQQLLQRRVDRTISAIKHLLSSSYERKFNATRILAYMTRSLDFNAMAYGDKMLQTLCTLIEEFKAQDLHPLLVALGNLLVYSRGKAQKDEFEWLYVNGYFEQLVLKVKTSDCHSLMDRFLELCRKLLVESALCDRLFTEKGTQGHGLVKELVNILTKAITHICESRCEDLNSQKWPFTCHGFELSWVTVQANAFAVASQLLRLDKCVGKIEKRNYGGVGVKVLEKGMEQLLSFQKRRPQDSDLEFLIGELSLFIQLHYSMLPPTRLAKKVYKLSKELAQLCKEPKVSEQLQAKSGSLLLHTILNIPLNKDAGTLSEAINLILFLMTNAQQIDLQYLSVWSLRQLYLRCKYSVTAYDYQFAFAQCNVIRNVVPKMVQAHQQLQEAALLCLGSLFEYPDMLKAFIAMDVEPLPRLMELGQSIFTRFKHKKQEDLSLLAAFGNALGRLLNGQPQIQESLNSQFQVMEFIMAILWECPGREELAAVAVEYISSLSYLLENQGLQQDFLTLRLPEGRSPLNLLNSFFHKGDNPAYVQLQIDCCVAKCFSLLSSNPANRMHQPPLFGHFAELLKTVSEVYDQIEYLSKFEEDTHKFVIKTVSVLLRKRGEWLTDGTSDEERERFLQELEDEGVLAPVLFFENSNIPEVRETATRILNFLAPPLGDN